MSNLDVKETQGRVLVVDDDMAMRLLLRESLNQSGFQVVDADSGPQALLEFQKSKPDLVMLDVEMPGMDGFTVCEKLRAMPNGEHIPVIMVTGREDHESVTRAFHAGATDFLVKPINWAVVGHHVRYVLRAAQSYQALQRSEGRLKALILANPDLIFRLRRDGNYDDPDVALHAAAILNHDNFCTLRSQVQIDDHNTASTLTSIERIFIEESVQCYEYELKVDGQPRHFEARLVASDGAEVMAIVRDITQRKESEEQIRYLAYYDSLTGLPNRMLYQDHLKHALMRASKNNATLSVMFLDLDRFKLINDTLGHNVGDGLLLAVGERLKHSLRQSDLVARDLGQNPLTSVARIGGDEFILLLGESNDPTAVANRILQELAQPFRIEGHEVFITPSIGIANYPDDGEEVETLVKNADTAMYHAKSQGRNNYKFYSESMGVGAMVRLNLENDLRRALEREEFLLHYQPVVDLNSLEVTGMEVLVRWQHPEHGLVPPDEFIPIAEETGLILPIGEWVLQTACRQTKAWQIQGYRPIQVAINISGRQFRDSSFLSSVTQALNCTELDPKYVVLELTESILMADAKGAIASLAALKAMGLTFSVDDFGTGYSSLSYLKKFPLDILKVDRSFMRDVITDPDDAAIVTAIIAMAHQLNLNVVAEGVETEEQMQFLRLHKCREIQGYHISRPLPAEDIVKFLVPLNQPAPDIQLRCATQQ